MDGTFERVMGSARSWRRLARRATAAHEREVGALARQIAAAAPPVRAASVQPLRGTGADAVVTLSISVPGWELELAGVAATAAGGLPAAGGAGRLTRTGRYGVFWWIELSTAGDAAVLLGSSLRISAAGDGAAAAYSMPAPALVSGAG